jgi:hypothetical protein
LFYSLYGLDFFFDNEIVVFVIFGSANVSIIEAITVIGVVVVLLVVVIVWEIVVFFVASIVVVFVVIGRFLIGVVVKGLVIVGGVVGCFGRVTMIGGVSVAVLALNIGLEELK